MNFITTSFDIYNKNINIITIYIFFILIYIIITFGINIPM